MHGLCDAQGLPPQRKNKMMKQRKHNNQDEGKGQCCFSTSFRFFPLSVSRESHHSFLQLVSGL